ncbi:MAG: cupredoxin domain-containing protein [Candidatus Micrarchaeia archaeon]
MKLLMAFLLAAAILAGCTGNAAQTDKGNLTNGKTVQINVTAKQWEFVPNTITVDQGDTVKLTVSSADVAHGFALPEYGINERIEPGKPVVITFVADKSGEFGFRCSVMCGEGHRGQTGKLVVRPA